MSANGTTAATIAKTDVSDLVWDVAELLRGTFKQTRYGAFFLPFTVLRRLDCVLEDTKGAVLGVVSAHKLTNLDSVNLEQRKTLERVTCSLKKAPEIGGEF